MTTRLLVLAAARSSLRRSFTSKPSFSEFEYPLRTEAPVVSRTKASDSSSAADTSTTASASYRAPTAKKYASDVFDDSRTLSELERTSIQSAQRTMINTTLFGSQPILTSPPNHIPPNISASQLEVPKTIISTLPNGIKVVSQETYGQVCCIGLLANMGSRLETTVGTCHLLELTGFQSTPTYQSPADIQETLQKWGGTSFCHIGNEQALWCLDILRPNVQQGFELLKDVVLHANFTDDEVAMSKQAIRFQWEDMKPEPLVPEAVLMAAYGSDQQLGRPHICKFQMYVYVCFLFCKGMGHATNIVYCHFYYFLL